MFAIIFAFAFITIHIVEAEIPPYIHVCALRDPNMDKCIVKNIENLKGKICEGIPELKVKSLNPLFLDEIVIFNTSSIKLFMKNSEMTGLCDFVVNFFYTDVIDKFHFNIDLSFKHIYINSTYDLNISLLVPIAQKARFFITTDNVGAKAGADMKIVTKNGKRYLYISKIKLDLDIKKFYIEIEEDEKEFNQLIEIVTLFIGDNQKEIIKSFKPVLEETISKQLITFSNDIVTHFTYEELFPDRT